MYMEATNPQNTSGRWLTNRGPGVTSRAVRAPRSTAVVPLPGIPSVRRGIMEPFAAALLADSGAATPRMSPRPKLPSSPASFSSTA